MDTITNTKINRAEKIFQSLVDTGHCTEDAKLWMINATDPFHDVPERITGMPDIITTPSVVQTFKYTFTVARPPIVPAGSNWDALICMHQVDGITNITNTSISNGNVLTYNNPQVPVTFGGVVAYGVASGNPITLSNVIGQTSLNNGIIASGMPFRTLSKAYEVENTTSLLNKQGSVIVFNVPNQDPTASQSTWHLQAPGGPVPPLNLFDGVGSGPLIGSLPATPAEAMILPYSRQWEAQYGVYQVATMCSQTNQPSDLGPEFFIIKDAADLGPNPFRVPLGSLLATNNTVSGSNVWPISPFNTPGSYWTGLSSETTLTVTAIWTIERFPSFDNNDLVTMATPSPAYCPFAIEAYATAMRKMPVGVKKGDNDMGDYVATLADIVAPFLGLPPVGTVIKKGYDMINGVLSNVNTKAQRSIVKDHPVINNWENSSGFVTNVQPRSNSNTKLPLRPARRQPNKNKPKQKQNNNNTNNSRKK